MKLRCGISMRNFMPVTVWTFEPSNVVRVIAGEYGGTITL
jgi:hypothetical protein